MTAETTQAKQYFRTWDLSECIKHRCSLSSPQEINQSRHAIRREEKRSQASPSPGAARVKADRAWGKTGRTLPEQEYCSGLLEWCMPEEEHTIPEAVSGKCTTSGMKRVPTSGESASPSSDSFHPPEYARRHGP